MWRDAFISTLMLYQFDNTIFDLFRVPGDDISKETVVDSILAGTAEFSVIYPAPDTLKAMVGLWANKNFSVWEELWKTLHYDYNPIHNYDREEHGKDILDGKNVQTHDLTNEDTYTRNLTDAGHSLNKRAAMNEGLADETSNDSKVDYTGNTKDVKKDTGTLTDKKDDIDTHHFHAFGNIGVTTTQEMIKQQREIVQFNLIDYIVNDYKQNFCIMVY